MPKVVKGENCYTPGELAKQTGTSRWTIIRFLADDNRRNGVRIIRDTENGRYYVPEQSVSKLTERFSARFVENT